MTESRGKREGCRWCKILLNWLGIRVTGGPLYLPKQSCSSCTQVFFYFPATNCYSEFWVFFRMLWIFNSSSQVICIVITGVKLKQWLIFCLKLTKHLLKQRDGSSVGVGIRNVHVSFRAYPATYTMDTLRGVGTLFPRDKKLPHLLSTSAEVKKVQCSSLVPSPAIYYCTSTCI